MRSIGSDVLISLLDLKYITIKKLSKKYRYRIQWQLGLRNDRIIKKVHKLKDKNKKNF